MTLSLISMNRNLKALILVIALLAFHAQSSAQTVSADVISDDERAAIIKTGIELWFSRAEKLPPAEGSDLLKHNTLSVEDLSANLVSKLSGIKLVLRQRNKIKQLEHRSTPVRYLRVTSLIRAGDAIELTLAAIGRVNDTTLGAHSYHYLFEKVEGHWQGKLIYIIC